MSNPNTLEFAQGQLADIASSYGQPYMPNASISFIDGTSKQVSPALKAGKLWFALREDDTAESLTIGNNSVSLGRHRAYIFLDDDSNRYAITGPVNWDEIYDKPDLISRIAFSDIGDTINTANNDINGRYKRLISYKLDNQELSSAPLPFLYANTDDTMTGNLTMHDTIINIKGLITYPGNQNETNALQKSINPYIQLTAADNVNKPAYIQLYKSWTRASTSNNWTKVNDGVGIGYGWEKSLKIDQEGNVQTPGKITIDINTDIGIELKHSKLIRGMANGNIGMRAYDETTCINKGIAYVGQINISNNFDGFGSQQWGAQMSGYDGIGTGEANSGGYSHIRISHEGLEYKSSTDKTVFNMNNKVTLEYKTSTESLDFSFT